MVRIPYALDVILHDDIDELSHAVACRVATISAETINEHGNCSIVLAGGGTPRGCYEKLCDMHVDWKNVRIYFGDERCLPYGDPERNDFMAFETLLKHIPIPHENVHGIPAQHGARIAAIEYSTLIERVLPFDLALLGMGEDGHTASLFPGNLATENKDIVAPVFNAPKSPAERVSLSMGTLNSARKKIFLISGKSKQHALEKIMCGLDLPAARVRGAEWHIDRAACPYEMLSGS